MGAPAKAMPYGKLVDDSLTSGGIYMSGSSDALATVTLRVNRFTPRPERDRPARSGSPFAKKSSPFGGASASARRRPRGKQ